MTTVLNIRSHSVQVDITAELYEYDFGHNARWTSDKLVASSPFRTDNAPSFFVNLTGEYAGTWGDSGALDDEYARGNFVSLIAHLRGTDYDEACDYLIDKYGVLYEIKPDDPMRIKHPKLQARDRRYLPLTEGTVISATSPYLLTRGIDAEIQAEYGIGYNERNKGHTAIPWHCSQTGEIMNVKYRSTRDKRFFYERGAKPVSEMIYGLWQARDSDYNVVCEGEIDALSWAVADVRAIALGGAHMSRKQADLIRRSGARRIYLAGDNDEQGAKLNDRVERMLRGYARMFTVDYGKNKDANDVLLRHGVDELREIIEGAAPVRAINLRYRPE